MLDSSLHLYVVAGPQLKGLHSTDGHARYGKDHHYSLSCASVGQAWPQCPPDLSY